MRRVASTVVTGVAVLVVLAAAALATATAEQQCQAARLKAAGRYAACQQIAQANFQTRGNGDTQNSSLQADVSRCRVKYTGIWASLQKKPALVGSSCIGPRFVDNGTTVTDNLTGLQWEKKTSVDDSPNLADPQDADNTYPWTSTGTAADGSAFTDFLSSFNNGGCFAGHCDWRLPTRDELLTILSQPYPCTSGPCIDSVFGPTRDGRADAYYWSSSTYVLDSGSAWVVGFHDGFVEGPVPKFVAPHTRAVRGGL